MHAVVLGLSSCALSVPYDMPRLGLVLQTGIYDL
jgi:hypothetical protein